MKMLWICFEFLVNLFQGMTVIYFPYAYLGGKNNKSFIKCNGWLFGLILTVLISVMNFCTSINVFTTFENYMAVVYILPVVVFSIIYLKNSVFKKIFISIFSILITLFCSALTPNFIAFLLDKNLDEILTVNNFDRFITIISVQLMILLFMALSLALLKKFNGSRNELGRHEWILIVGVLTISILICTFINIVALDSISQKSRRYLVLAVAGIILINVAVCLLVTLLGRRNTVFRENEILKIEQIYNRQIIENANSEFENIRKLKHDIKDGYSIVYELISKQQNVQAMQFIEQSLDICNRSEVFINTDNWVVNAVINSKLSRAKSMGINVICSSVWDFTGINDMDLARLLSNLIDNAITACSASTKNDKCISLNISMDEYKYSVFIKNTIDDSVLKNNPLLCSTKMDSREHGYGTKIVRDIAYKYKGRCDFYEMDGCFCCSIILLPEKNN